MSSEVHSDKHCIVDKNQLHHVKQPHKQFRIFIRHVDENPTKLLLLIEYLCVWLDPGWEFLRHKYAFSNSEYMGKRDHLCRPDAWGCSYYCLTCCLVFLVLIPILVVRIVLQSRRPTYVKPRGTRVIPCPSSSRRLHDGFPSTMNTHNGLSVTNYYRNYSMLQCFFISCYIKAPSYSLIQILIKETDTQHTHFQELGQV